MISHLIFFLIWRNFNSINKLNTYLSWLTFWHANIFILFRRQMCQVWNYYSCWLGHRKWSSSDHHHLFICFLALNQVLFVLKKKKPIIIIITHKNVIDLIFFLLLKSETLEFLRMTHNYYYENHCRCSFWSIIDKCLVFNVISISF